MTKPTYLFLETSTVQRELLLPEFGGRLFELCIDFSDRKRANYMEILGLDDREILTQPNPTYTIPLILMSKLNNTDFQSLRLI